MRILTLTAILLATAVPVLASPKCTAPKEQWRNVEELKTQLTSKGWTIKNVKVDEGCYEVYGKDENGKKVEIYFDPVSFEAVGSDD